MSDTKSDFVKPATLLGQPVARQDRRPTKHAKPPLPRTTTASPRASSMTPRAAPPRRSPPLPTQAAAAVGSRADSARARRPERARLRRRDELALRGDQEGQHVHHRTAAHDDRAAAEGGQGREHPARGVRRPQEAGPDLPHPQGAGEGQRPDVRRGHARGPARRLRLPPQPRLQLPALPRRHLHLAVPDPPLRPAHRRRRRRPDPPAEGERALLRPAPRRGDQLLRAGPAHAEGRLRRPDAAAPEPATQARNRPRTS